MRRLYQKNWFGIDFKSFTTLDSKKIADAVFYDKFYDEFYKKFSSYEQLPENWRSDKKLVADLILQLTNTNDRILSIGCGNGYIEYLLSKERKNIVAIEPVAKATKFLKQFSDVKIYDGYFPECLENTNESHFDLAYMSVVEYVFNKNKLLNFLRKIKDFKIKNFLLVSAAVYDENFSLIQLIKNIAKLLLSSIGLYKSERGQFWGYQRKPSELIGAFKKVGFKNIKFGFFRKNYFWIMGNSF